MADLFTPIPQHRGHQWGEFEKQKYLYKLLTFGFFPKVRVQIILFVGRF